MLESQPNSDDESVIEFYREYQLQLDRIDSTIRAEEHVHKLDLDES